MTPFKASPLRSLGPLRVNLVVARIALDLPIATLFDFSLPAEVIGATERTEATQASKSSADKLDDLIGRLAIVPFGPKKCVGVIVDITHATAVPLEKLKAVLHIQHELPAFSASDLALFRFCEGYYHQSFGQIALNAIPPGMRVPKSIGRALTIRAQPDIIAITTSGREALPNLPGRSVVQRAILQSLVTYGPQDETAIKVRHESGATSLNALLRKGWAEVQTKMKLHAQTQAQAQASEKSTTRAVASAARISLSRPIAPIEFFDAKPLNAQQTRALAAIVGGAGQFAAFLLAGITGSGKTEVYLHAIRHALEHGYQALILVPEINLSPAFVRAVAARFPTAQVAQLHSGMAEMPRMTGYLDAQSGRADIVIGTRLAVFTPMPRLGLIVVDEEHDASFKQQEGFRYSARDVAVFRARAAGCAVVLGSATPSLETLNNVARGRFVALALTARATPDAQLPRVDFIDLNIERTTDGLTAGLIHAIEETVKRGEQALVFINRRGFAPALVCAQCGTMPECARCTARLVFHKNDNRLKCHHCGYQTRVPTSCASCGSHELIAAGQGTERIETALQTALQASLPQLRMARVDRDSTRKRGAAEKIFDAASKGELDVLVGTQMLSKGHDFPKLTMVGVVNADGAMFSADFRASERLAAQLMQVAGRAGRASLPGRVLIQTRFPTHPLYQAVAAQDYARFADIAMAERRHAALPPFSFLALLRAESKQAESLAKFMADIATNAQTLAPAHGVHVWDPVPPTLARKAGYERRQLMVQADSRAVLQRFLSHWLIMVRQREVRAVKWVIDVDPLEV